MDVLNDSTECPASAANTVEDHNKLGERISDAIDPDDQPDDRSNLIIDLGPEAGDPISFEPVTEPDIWNDCSDIIFDTGPTAQPPELITTSSEMINPAVPILNSQPKPVPNSFQPVLIPYLHDQPPYHHFPSLHPPLMPFCPQNFTQSPCQVDPRSLHLTSEENCVSSPPWVPPNPDEHLDQPSDFTPAPPVPDPSLHFPYFPVPPNSFHHPYPQLTTPHHHYPHPETPHHPHPLPRPPSPDVANNNINHNQKSNYNGVINNLLQDYPELCLEELNIEPKIPYPNHQDYNIDEYQQQHYEYKDHQDAPNDQFDYHQDDSADYGNGRDDFNYDDGGYNYDDGGYNYDDGGYNYDNNYYYDDYD
ncbi:hypothetical protein PCASD_01790 [Puccinia coronata f. sp. avenae]|uniref:Uncharacterized protein n=1 Tax=Puccinia coronata f. sp. avenae TaxID=200324 RepID=A0A2N5VJF4_9BASI|nr:hypothetical protein PCASD_01790 [Puccinia coronata f. sp. avenae]